MHNKNLVIAIFLGIVKADQPVSCPEADVVGQWNFHVSAETANVNLFKANEVCTHQLPNKLQILAQGSTLSFASESIWKMNLKEDLTVEAQQCDDKGSCQGSTSGTWMPFYDQAFKVELDNGQRFITNYRYALKEYVSNEFLEKGAKTIKDVQTDDYDKFYSLCDRTMVGFVQNKQAKSSLADHHVECFYGIKTASDHPEAAKPDPKAQVQTEGDGTTDITLLQLKTTTRRRGKQFKSNPMMTHVPSDETDLEIIEHNASNSTWKANVCMLQKHHKDYGAHCDKPISLAQVSQTTDSQTSTFAEALTSAQSWAETYLVADNIPDEKLPETYDFRNINGHDFTNAVRSQDHCGACHAISFIQTVEARLKLKTGKDVPQLSMQQLLACNYLNEGCQGGWAMFNGYLAENGHLVTEECGPYRGSTNGDSCKFYEKCAPAARIDDSYFIQVSPTAEKIDEAKIRKEILRNGPVVGEFKAPNKFRYYDKGVLVDEQRPANAANVQLETDAKVDLGIANQNLDHSIMLMGWGHDPASGYDVWIARNSFGPNWGEKGDFYIRRGQNDFGIESEVSAYLASLA